MRKILLGLLVILLLALAVYTAVYGIELGGLKINSIPAIKEENEVLESKIDKASKLRTTQYPSEITVLEGAYKKLVAEKENYEQILALGVDENGQPINKIQEYEMEKIWVAMGNHAKAQGVDLKMDVTLNNSVSKTYDLKFTVTGGYIQIVDFLYDVERDSTLVFKIENFKLVAGETTDVLVGTFTCKDIKINITDVTSSNSTSIGNNTDSSTGNTNTNTNSNTSTNTNTNSNSNTNTNARNTNTSNTSNTNTQ